MSCELTLDLKPSPAHNAHAASKDPTLNFVIQAFLDGLVSMTVVEIA